MRICVKWLNALERHNIDLRGISMGYAVQILSLSKRGTRAQVEVGQSEADKMSHAEISVLGPPIRSCETQISSV
jgi:hypothetical protein